MIFRLVEDLFKHSRVFSDKEDAKEYVRKNVDGFYNITQDDEDPEAFKLEWDNNKDLNNVSDEKEYVISTPEEVWGDKKQRGQKFVDKYRDQLRGLRVYYLAFKNGKPLTDSTNNMIYYKNKQDAINKIKYYDIDLDVVSYII